MPKLRTVLICMKKGFKNVASRNLDFRIILTGLLHYPVTFYRFTAVKYNQHAADIACKHMREYPSIFDSQLRLICWPQSQYQPNIYHILNKKSEIEIFIF